MNCQRTCTRAFRLGVISLAWSILATTVPAAAAGRVVAVGDIHGEYDGFTAILREAGIIDESARWVGGDATLVQTGDMLDRGPDVRKVLDLLMTLEKQAPKQRGRVEVLLGNHEMMNLLAQYRDVGPEAYAAFADGESEERRQMAFDGYSRYASKRAQDQGQAQEQPAVARAQWLAAHPPGLLEYRAALGPKGRYGKWLRKRPIAVEIDGVAFIHAGTSPDLEAASFDEINDKIHEELADFDRFTAQLAKTGAILPFFDLDEISQAVKDEIEAIVAAAEKDDATRPARPREEEILRREALAGLAKSNTWWSLTASGPLWFRGFATWPEEAHQPQVDGLLQRYGVRHFVVGHSPMAPVGMIKSRFDGKVLLIDTGMLASRYRGRPSALEIKDGIFTAIYAGSRERLHPPLAAVAAVDSPQAPPAAAAPHHAFTGASGQPLPFRSDEEIVEFLEQAQVVSTDRIPTGITQPQRLLLERDGIQARAVLRTVDVSERSVRLRDGSLYRNFRDSYTNELAAHALARLLDMSTVPPVAKRKIDGRWGSVQLWIENAMTESDWNKRAHQPLAEARHHLQLYTMRVFDNLIGNIDRNLGNYLTDASGRVWYIDHTRSFPRSGQLPEPELIFRVDRRFWEKLEGLRDERFKETLRPYLGNPEITGFLSRRSKVVEKLRARIEKWGEEQVLIDLERIYQELREAA